MLAEHADPDIRASAVRGLASIGGGAAARTLARRLGDEPDGWVRRSAAILLGEIGAVEGVSALIGALDDEESVVRNAAARALGSVRTPQAVTALERAFARRDDAALRFAAAEALERQGVLRRHGQSRVGSVAVWLVGLALMAAAIVTAQDDPTAPTPLLFFVAGLVVWSVAWFRSLRERAARGAWYEPTGDGGGDGSTHGPIWVHSTDSGSGDGFFGSFDGGWGDGGGGGGGDGGGGG